MSIPSSNVLCPKVFKRLLLKGEKLQVKSELLRHPERHEIRPPNLITKKITLTKKTLSSKLFANVLYFYMYVVNGVHGKMAMFLKFVFYATAVFFSLIKGHIAL